MAGAPKKIVHPSTAYWLMCSASEERARLSRRLSLRTQGTAGANKPGGSE